MSREIYIKELEAKSQRVDSILTQRQALFDQIGTGQIRLDSSPGTEDYLDTALRIGSAKKRVIESIGRLESKRTELAGQIHEEKLTELKSYVDQGIFPASILTPYITTVEGGSFEDSQTESTQHLEPQTDSQQIPDIILVPFTEKSSAHSEQSTTIESKPIEPIKITLPDGQVAETLSANVAKTVEALSTGKTSINELAIYVFGEDNPQNRNKAKDLIRTAREKLATTSWSIENLINERAKPGIYELRKTKEAQTPSEETDLHPGEQIELPSPSQGPILDVEPAKSDQKESENTTKNVHELILPDGQVVQIAGDKRAKVLKAILEGHSVITDIVISVYGEDFETGRTSANQHIHRLSADLLPLGYQIKNLTSHRQRIERIPAKYVIEKIDDDISSISTQTEANETVLFSTPIPEQTEPEKNPHEFTFPDGTKFISPRILTIKILEAVATHSGSSGNIALKVFGEVNDQSKGSARSEISRLRRLLAKQGHDWTIERIETDGNVSYELKSLKPTNSPQQIQAEEETSQLYTDESEIEGDEFQTQATSEKRHYVKDSIIPDFYEKKPREIKLPNGKIIEVDSAWPHYLAKYIAEGTNSIGEIANLVYGEDNKVNRGRVSAAIAGANHTISESGFIIVNIVSPSEKNKGVPARFEFKTQEVYALSRKPRQKDSASKQPTPGTIIEVPYVPSPEEIRSPEENRVVIAITEALRKSQIIYFTDLQRFLRTEERVRTRLGQTQYRPYQAEELKRLFQSGLKKFIDQSATTLLRDQWTEGDTLTWEAIQTNVYRLTEENSFDEYVKKVKKLIDEAAREFAEQHDGVIPHWINLPNNGGKK